MPEGVRHACSQWPRRPHLRVAGSCLLNKYRTLADSMGWHSDNERPYGSTPTIASVSLGAPRDFDMRHNASRRRIRVTLSAGDVLIMRGTMQQHWQHAVPKGGKSAAARAGGDQADPRINLTFRTILHPEAQ